MEVPKTVIERLTKLEKDLKEVLELKAKVAELETKIKQLSAKGE